MAAHGSMDAPNRGLLGRGKRPMCRRRLPSTPSPMLGSTSPRVTEVYNRKEMILMELSCRVVKVEQQQRRWRRKNEKEILQTHPGHVSL